MHDFRESMYYLLLPVSRAFSESVSIMNLSFCTIRNIFDRLLEQVEPHWHCHRAGWPPPGPGQADSESD